jgi:hypothetical protein
MTYPSNLPVFPTSFKKSTICAKFEVLDEATLMLAETVWDVARNFVFDTSTSTTTTTTTTTSAPFDEAWPTEEPTTMRHIVAMVMLYCDYIVRYESFCQDLMDWAEEKGSDEAMSAVEDRLGSLDDMSCMARDVMDDVRMKGRVDAEVIEALEEMFSAIEGGR